MTTEELSDPEVGSYFRTLRRTQKISQKVFAEKIGISVRKLRKFEHSTDPDVFVLQKVVGGFGGELVINACFGEEKHRIL